MVNHFPRVAYMEGNENVQHTYLIVEHFVVDGSFLIRFRFSLCFYEGMHSLLYIEQRLMCSLSLWYPSLQVKLCY